MPYKTRIFAAMIAVACANAPQIATADMPKVDGQVTKIDQSAGKMTLRHGPIKNLDMDGMTMVFRVKNPAMLTTVKVGDKVQFQADRVNGALTVIQIKKK
jgi:Cu(I)/Ag(I) efflux system protein CusF